MRRRRPLSIAIVGWLFVATGVVGFVVSIVLWVRADAATEGPASEAHELADFVVAAASGGIAALGGAFTLRGANWARWLLIAWMAGHLVLSVAHSTERLLLHVAFFAPLLYLLLRAPAAAFFRAPDTRTSDEGVASPARNPEERTP